MKFSLSADLKRLETDNPNIFVERCQISREAVFYFRLNWEQRRIMFSAVRESTMDAAGRDQVTWFLETMGCVDLDNPRHVFKFRDDAERRDAVAMMVDALSSFDGVVNVRALHAQRRVENSVELSPAIQKIMFVHR